MNVTAVRLLLNRNLNTFKVQICKWFKTQTMFYVVYEKNNTIQTRRPIKRAILSTNDHVEQFT